MAVMQPGSTSVLHPVYLNTGSVFQRDVRNMPLAGNSAQIAANIRQQQINTGYYTGLSAWQYNFPSYVIDSNETPMATVTWRNLRGWTWTPQDVMDAAFGQKPIPEYAVPAGGTDKALVVYDAATDTMWEWWQMIKTGPRQWAAEWGSRTLNANNNFTNRSDVGSLSASGLNGVLGQIGIGEIRAGKINHALIFALPSPGVGYSWPAKQSDGSNGDANAPKEGQWGRLNPNFNVESLDNELLRLVGRAAQRYGIVLVDIAGSVSFCGESGAHEAATTGVNPWTSIFANQGNGKADWEVLHGFPWEQTQWAPIDWRTEPWEVFPDGGGGGTVPPPVEGVELTSLTLTKTGESGGKDIVKASWVANKDPAQWTLHIKHADLTEWTGTVSGTAREAEFWNVQAGAVITVSAGTSTTRSSTYGGAPSNDSPPTAGVLTPTPGQRQIEVWITGATDDIGLHAEPYAYSLETGGAWSGWTTWGSLAGTILIDLQPSTTYRVQHKVRDSAGQETLGEPITVTTLADERAITLPVLPSVRSSTATTHSSGALAVTAETVKRPPLVEAGDLLVLYAVMDAGTTGDLVPPAGFTELGKLGTGTNNPAGGVFYKVAGVSEPATYTYVRYSADSDGASLMVAVRDWDGDTANLRFQMAETTMAARTVPSVTPAKAAGLVLTSVHHDANAAATWGWVAPGQGLLAGVAHNAGGWASVGVASQIHATAAAVSGLSWAGSRTSSTVSPMVTSALTVGAGNTTVPAQVGQSSGGTGGPQADQTNLSFSSGGLTNTYHRYAAGLDWTKPVGLLIWTDGSAEFGLTNPTSAYLLAGTNGMVAVAKRHNMILLTPMAPGGPCNDGDGVCWYDNSGTVTPTQKLAWSHALIQQVLGQYDIDKSRIVFGGYSSGAQWTTQFWGPEYAHTVITDGAAIAVSYGGQPKGTNKNTQAYRDNVPYLWNAGELDDAWRQPTWGDSIQKGIDAYSPTYTVRPSILAGITHDRYVSNPTEGEFGRIVNDAIVRHVRPAVTINVPETFTQFAELAAAGDLAGSGRLVLASTGPVNGDGQVTAAPVKITASGTPTMAADATLTGSGQTSQEGAGTATLTGQADLIAAAVGTVSAGAATLAAAGLLEAATDILTADGTAMLDGAGTLTGSGVGESGDIASVWILATGLITGAGQAHIPVVPPRRSRPGPAYSIDGVPLDDPGGRWWVSDRTEEMKAPPLELHTLNLTAGQIGEIDAPSPGYGAAVWPLVMGIRGGDYVQAKAFKDELDRFMLGRHGLATIIEAGPDLSKLCRGIVAAGTEVERFDSGFRLDVAYPVRIPAGRWFDVEERSVTLGDGNRIAGDTQDGTYLLGPLLGGSRDMDITIQTIGNGSNTDVRVTDVASGQWVRIAGNIILGTPIVIDPVALTATAGGLPVSGLLDFSARDMYLSPSATVRVQQNGSQPVTVRARRAYT